MTVSAVVRAERPILFSGPMVRAILDGRKTQTRRVVQPQPNSNGFMPTGLAKCDDCGNRFERAPKRCQCGCTLFRPHEAEASKCRCPYGLPGDRLWVRETHCIIDGLDSDPDTVCYQADGATAIRVGDSVEMTPECSASDAMDSANDKWRPSIHMPRWASRITLEIADVRVQRIQDISEEDALAEGVNMSFIQNDLYWQGGATLIDQRNPAFDTGKALTGPRGAFGMLWDSINAKRGFGWDANPWVWCLSLKRLP